MKRIFILITALGLAFSQSYGQTNNPTSAAQGEWQQTEQELQALEQAWADAVKHRDLATIDRIQAEEYVFTDPAGRLWTKARAFI